VALGRQGNATRGLTRLDEAPGDWSNTEGVGAAGVSVTGAVNRSSGFLTINSCTSGERRLKALRTPSNGKAGKT